MVSTSLLSEQTLYYLLTTSLPLYCPQALQTRCDNLASPQLGQVTIPGTDNLKCVRRFLLQF